MKNLSLVLGTGLLKKTKKETEMPEVCKLIKLQKDTKRRRAVEQFLRVNLGTRLIQAEK